MKIAVGLSGGVDSAVAAALLKEQGHEVIGVFMKNWSNDFGVTGDCPWEQDQKDAENVAKHLGIEFLSYNFELQYRERVIEYFFSEYKSGRTPNPDILCNSEIKFNVFLKKCLQKLGADMIATGHYARQRTESKEQRAKNREPLPIINDELLDIHLPHPIQRYVPYGTYQRHAPYGACQRGNIPAACEATRHSTLDTHNSSLQPVNALTLKYVNQTSSLHHLLKGLDSNKDQSYFLCRLTQEELARSVFPIGEYTKPQVRELARKFGIPVAEKKDSQGICFVGKINVREFIESELGSQPGDIVDIDSGKVLGKHKGLWFHTIGQREGLGLGGGPWFVAEKDLSANTVLVAKGFDNPALYKKEVVLEEINVITKSREQRTKNREQYGKSVREWKYASMQRGNFSEEPTHSLPSEPVNSLTREHVNNPRWNFPTNLQAFDAEVSLRYRQVPAKAKIESFFENDKELWKVTFDEPQRAVTPGQFGCVYIGDEVIGSGIICK